jgi:hypothetical protein
LFVDDERVDERAFVGRGFHEESAVEFAEESGLVVAEHSSGRERENGRQVSCGCVSEHVDVIGHCENVARMVKS